MTRGNFISRYAETIAILAIACLIALVGCSWATQEIAHRFGYQPALTGRFLKLPHSALYQPFAIFEWADRWSRHYPKPFAIPQLISALSIIGALGFSLLAFRPRPPQPQPFGAHAWGDFADAEKLGLFKKRGIVLGKLGKEILCHEGPAHVLLTGGTRSGKTRGAVIPTLLTWPHSAIVLDVKNELFGGDRRFGFKGTAAFRSQLGPVIRLALAEMESASFNPLESVRKGDLEVRDVQNIVEIIADPHGDGRNKDFWDQSAKSVLVGLILHVLYAEEEKTLKRVFELLADFDQTIKQMESTYHLQNLFTGAPVTHPAVARGAKSYRTYHDKLRAGIKATAESYLTLFDDPLIQKHTSRSDFSIDDLMCAERPVTLYLSWPPAEVLRLKPAIRLVLAPILFGLTERQDEGKRGGEKNHPLLLLLDEFPQLGKLDFFEKAMGAMAGYDIRAFLVAQSLNNINQAYGARNTILDNCAITAVFSAADIETAETISKMAGEIYERRPQETWSGKPGGLWLSQRSITYKDEKRPLILPSEVRSLPANEQMLFVEGGRPIRAKKLKYHSEPIFQSRLFETIIPQIALTTTHDWSDCKGFGQRAAPAPPPSNAQSKSNQKAQKPDDLTPDLFETVSKTPDPETAVDAAPEIVEPAGADEEAPIDQTPNEPSADKSDAAKPSNNILRPNFRLDGREAPAPSATKVVDPGAADPKASDPNANDPEATDPKDGEPK